MRLSQLGNRLQNLQVGLESDKIVILSLEEWIEWLSIQSKSETFENKVKLLDDKITKNHQLNEDKFKILKDQITKIQEGLATEIIAREVTIHRYD